MTWASSLELKVILPILVTPSTNGELCMEALVIYKLGSMKFATHYDLY